MLDYDEILPGQVWLGCGNVATKHQEELQELGITHVVNVSNEVANKHPRLFTYLRIPVEDGEDEDLRVYFDEAHKFIDDALSGGGRVYVHCKAGISRSTTVLAYLVKENNWTVEKAIGFIKRKRNIVKPNDGFITQLYMYRQTLAPS